MGISPFTMVFPFHTITGTAVKRFGADFSYIRCSFSTYSQAKNLTSLRAFPYFFLRHSTSTIKTNEPRVRAQELLPAWSRLPPRVASPIGDNFRARSLISVRALGKIKDCQ